MRCLLSLVILLAALPLFARDLPADGLLANLTAREYPFVGLSGKLIRLAPGALIYDGANRVIPPNTLPGSAAALYTLDSRGDVQKIWLLTGEEAAVMRDRKQGR